MGSIATEHFSYSPLNVGEREIRLLILHPGTRGEPIACHLEVVSIYAANQIPYYEALSYTWGSPATTVPIFINDEVLHIRSNLWWALDSLRYPEQNRVLWVDAICINQENVRERNHQVQQMGDIFSRASQINVWLGPTTRASWIAFRFLERIQAIDRAKFSDLHRSKRSEFVRRLACSNEEWEMLLKLSENDYWKRVWIVQEVVLARQIHVFSGTDRVPWKYLSDVFYLLHLTDTSYLPTWAHALKYSMPARLQDLRDYRKHGACDLSNLLVDCAHALCVVAHDKIYGLLGLVTDYKSADFEVDYSKGLLEVHRDIVSFYNRKCHRKLGSLEDSMPISQDPLNYLEFDVFVFAVHAAQLLSCHHGMDLERYNTMKRVCKYDPSSDSQIMFSGNFLSLGRITAVQDSGTRDKHCSEQLARPLDPEGAAAFITPYLIREQERTICFDETLSYAVLSTYAHFALPTSNEAKSVGSGRISRNTYKYDAGKPFWSTQGYLGFIPSSAIAGDLLYKSPNSDLTLVVRPEQSRCRIIGTALVMKSPFMTMLRSFCPEDSADELPQVAFVFDMETFQFLTTR